MSDRHRGVPQIHIDSAESEMHPSNVEQVCCLSPESLRRRTDRGCRAPEAGNPGKGTLDRAKNGQSSAVPAPGPLGPGDST